jgi:hypothetical protein
MLVPSLTYDGWLKKNNSVAAGARRQLRQYVCVTRDRTYLFRKACEFVLVGLMSNHRERPLSRWSIEALVQAQQPQASGDEPADAIIRDLA